MFEQLPDKFPSADEDHLRALADVWSEELHRIISRMLDIACDEFGPAMHIEARTEAIFELAKLILWLEEGIVEKKTQDAAIEEIDPEDERAALKTQEIQERIENTARICAERIWIPLQKKWGRQFPLISTTSSATQDKRSLLTPRERQAPGVRNQHYSPVFSNKYWAQGSQRHVRAYSRTTDSGITSEDVGYRTWGREAFIYSQQLERLFGLIEGDASSPYTKLLDTIPFTEQDRRHWIAFLVAQLLRTPSFILQHLPRLRSIIEDRRLDYPTDTASLRRAYETLFTNNEVFAQFYRQLTARKWELWSAPSQCQFLRSDDPILISGSIQAGDWQLLYPMTPSRCFVVGQHASESPPSVVPVNRELNESELASVNERIAKTARKTVVAVPTPDDSDLRVLLEQHLGVHWSNAPWLQNLFPEFWGRIG